MCSTVPGNCNLFAASLILFWLQACSKNALEKTITNGTIGKKPIVAQDGSRIRTSTAKVISRIQPSCWVGEKRQFKCISLGCTAVPVSC
mmetsp:Transcript_1277/g.1572  ORF Transcript_1277/g.1572 Transcript_1277/m.1572 type:complete len:89 (+) Transcript_1277:84-350(+)